MTDPPAWIKPGEATHRDGSVRVRFLIQNDGGRWTCHLHPFEFAKEAP